MHKLLNTIFKEHISVAELTLSVLSERIEDTGRIICKALKNGNKIFLFGNGGSAGDAQHIAAELMGRFLKERRGLPAIALTTDTSVLTAISNDYGYGHVFRRQVEALAAGGDVLIGISTSGNSENVVLALNEGKKLGCHLIGLSGRDGGIMNEVCDINLVVPSKVTARIQEMHITIGHILCELVDNEIIK
jgi:D-sedoheptulose 7-phosphate isomerase